MTAAQYDECIAALKKAGAQHPPGRHYHACFGTGDKMQVFDIWQSKEAFDKFGEVLLPILQQIGVDPGTPMVSEIHGVIVPPAKAPAKAAKPAAKPAKTTKAKKKARPAARKKILRRAKKK
jgi:hypothetical protein